jgi:hypothetical protein
VTDPSGGILLLFLAGGAAGWTWCDIGSSLLTDPLQMPFHLQTLPTAITNSNQGDQSNNQNAAEEHCREEEEPYCEEIHVETSWRSGPL